MSATLGQQRVIEEGGVLCIVVLIGGARGGRKGQWIKTTNEHKTTIVPQRTSSSEQLTRAAIYSKIDIIHEEGKGRWKVFTVTAGLPSFLHTHTGTHTGIGVFECMIIAFSKLDFIHGMWLPISTPVDQELPWRLLALYRRTLGSERHQYGNAWAWKTRI